MATPAPDDFGNHIVVAKAALSATASVTATMMVVRSVVQPFLPRELRGFLFSGIRGFLSRFSNEMTMVIDEYDGINPNELFQAAQMFLPAKQFPSMVVRSVVRPFIPREFQDFLFDFLISRIRGFSSRFCNEMTMETHSTAAIIDQNQMLVDTFHGVKLKWALVSRQVGSGNRVHQGPNSTVQHGDQYFELTFDKKHVEIVDKSYLPFVMDQAKSIKQGKKTLKLYTASSNSSFSGPWSSVNLDHPATFQTLAMDLELKKKILDDLDMRVGKVWKRGYLLYEPPGTGKSSLVAAMANHLNFDIYDLELSGLRSNADLRRLLVATANQSILVVTLSGFLNFTDGLWSSCGNERIIVFTTNHVEKLDPAILRPGRMDLHIPMSYCTPCGFRLLAYNYLGIDHHELFNQIESMITMARVTPTEVAEELMKCDESEIVLRDMVSFLTNHKRKENEEAI
ncbi:hypothetical protein EUGRSUZ_J02365 [Eucalyptus grandis]|uniref:AAA+ ATPase domain-containing protein n=2 Tax=Eucalyptus grandis TaxID=71139 RepID=A0A059AGV9_EUCGR|nr:hypothetical protein EUGRSUZ_J02365 [Eucalyptus grandis]